MAKSKNIDSFNGFTYGIIEEPKAKLQNSMDEIKKTKVKDEKEPKKRGRPKLNREIKERKTFTILQSDYEKASKIAYVEGRSVSEVLGQYLAEYVDKNQDKLEEYELLNRQ